MGYENDGENEGLKVQLNSSEPRVQSMIDGLSLPHMTIAVSDDGKPVNTMRLNFKEIEPIELTGKYGGCATGGQILVRDSENL